MEQTNQVPAACDTKKSVSSRRSNTGQKQLFDNGISVYCFNYKQQEKPWLVYKGVQVRSPKYAHFTTYKGSHQASQSKEKQRTSLWIKSRKNYKQ